MSIENLYLTQQMRETQRNLENRLEKKKTGKEEVVFLALLEVV